MLVAGIRKIMIKGMVREVTFVLMGKNKISSDMSLMCIDSQEDYDFRETLQMEDTRDY